MTKIQAELRGGLFLPVTEYDAQRIEDMKDGQLVNLSVASKRSNPHHNLYWSALRNVCKATGKWPTEAHLHHELKLACGYYKTTISPLTGGIVRSTDSISFEKMNQAEFMQYFEAAMEKLSEAIGYDPITQNT